MADLAIGISRPALDDLVNKFKNAIKEDKQQWQMVQRDLVFISNEFDMMQAFLNAAHGERIKNHVVKTWVRQVCDLSYDAEDCVDFIMHLDTRKPWYGWVRLLLPSCCLSGTLLLLDKGVAEITELRARVTEVSERNTRYNLISDTGSKPDVPMQQSAAASTRALDIFIKVKGAAEEQACSELTRLITTPDLGLQVISVCGNEGDLGAISFIRKVFDGPEIQNAGFKHRAWVEPVYPFNSQDFTRRLLAQFYTNSARDQGAKIDVEILSRMEASSENLVNKCVQEVQEHKCLVILEGISSLVQWDAIRSYLPDMNNGSRIVVWTHQLEIASLCTGQPYKVSELRRLSAEHSICVFFKEEDSLCDNVSDSDEHSSRLVDRAKHWLQNSHLLDGHRHNQEIKLEGLINLGSCECLIKRRTHVVSVCGIAGVGKSTLVRTVYSRCIFEKKFDKYAWAHPSHPFDIRDFSCHLLRGMIGEFNAKIETDPAQRCRELLCEYRWLVVIDHLPSRRDWDEINSKVIPSSGSPSCIVVITREESVAKYCATIDSGVCTIEGLEVNAALHFFETKVNGEAGTSNPNPRTTEEAELIIKKCCGLPSVILTLGNYLATQSDVEGLLKRLNANFVHELQTNIALQSIRGLFASVYSNFCACSQLHKKCIFYLSVFQQTSFFSRRRMVRRWIAEGYLKGTNSNSLEGDAQKVMEKLADMGLVRAAGDIKKSSYQVNVWFLEYIMWREMEEKVLLPLEISVLEEGRGLITERVGQHLAIRSTWVRDEVVFNSLDLSRLRSVSVFGDWRTFFISDKMRVLRVLDLEGTSDIENEHLEQIGELLPRLKFLSLRRCRKISSLPDSLGDLRQLQTLDIRDTGVAILPRSIIKLHYKLQYVRAGTLPRCSSREELPTPSTWEDLPIPSAREELPTPSSPSRWFSMSRDQPVGNHGVKVPRGIGTLKALDTLSVVNVNNAGGKIILRDLKMLSELRKLGVCGLKEDNSKEFWSAISCLTHLESLSVWGGKLPQDTSFLPSSLMKLNLDMPTHRLTSRNIQALGNIENLHTLRLHIMEEEDGGLNLFDAVGRSSADILGKQKVLRIACNDGSSVEFNGVVRNFQMTLSTLDSIIRNDAARSLLAHLLGQLNGLRIACSDGSIVEFDGAARNLRMTLSTLESIIRHDTARSLLADLLGQLNVLRIACNDGSIVEFDGVARNLQMTVPTLKNIIRNDTDRSLLADLLRQLNVLRISCSDGSSVEFDGVARNLELTLLTVEHIRLVGWIKGIHTLCLNLLTDEDRDELQLHNKLLSSGLFSELKVLKIACMSKNHLLGILAEGDLACRSTKHLHGILVEGVMKDLEQLTLEEVTLTQDDIHNLGKLKRLHTLCLDISLNQEEELCFPYKQETTPSSSSTAPDLFGELKVLDIRCRSKLNVMFPHGVMEKLERCVLEIPTYRLMRKDIDALRHLENLHTLRLHVMEVEGGLLNLFYGAGRSLADLIGKLKVLRIACSGGSSVEFDGAMMNLQMTLLTLENIRNLSNLTDEDGELHLDNVLGSSGIFSGLKILKIACRSTEQLHVKLAEGTMQLEWLTLEGTTVTQEDIHNLGKLKSLHTLCLRMSRNQQAELYFPYEQETICSSSSMAPDLFGELKVLDICCSTRLHMRFSHGMMEKLEKLTLETCPWLTQEDIQSLAKLKRLHTLCLHLVTGEEKGRLLFADVQETNYIPSSVPADCFGELKVLEITCRSDLYVEFAEGVMKKLEVLKVIDPKPDWRDKSPPLFSGLSYMRSLKEIQITRWFSKQGFGDLERQLEDHPNRPVLEEW